MGFSNKQEEVIEKSSGESLYFPTSFLSFTKLMGKVHSPNNILAPIFGALFEASAKEQWVAFYMTLNNPMISVISKEAAETNNEWFSDENQKMYGLFYQDAARVLVYLLQDME
jgi:hypothetical protein